MINMNGDDLISREYIHRQLGRNMMARSLEVEFHNFAVHHLETPEYALAPKFLDYRGLPCVEYFTFNTENIYEDHALFYFTHAGYYECTQLIHHVQSRMLEDMEMFNSFPALSLRRRLGMELDRLTDQADSLASDLRNDHSKVLRDPALVFLYDYVIHSLPVTEPSAYKFSGVFITVPLKICYIKT